MNPINTNPIIFQNGEIATRAFTAKNAGPTAGARSQTYAGGAQNREASRYAIAFGIFEWLEWIKWLNEQLLS